MKVLVTALFVISWVASALYLRISAEVSEPSFYVLYGVTGMALYLILEEIGVAK